MAVTGLNATRARPSGAPGAVTMLNRSHVNTGSVRRQQERVNSADTSVDGPNQTKGPRKSEIPRRIGLHGGWPENRGLGNGLEAAKGEPVTYMASSLKIPHGIEESDQNKARPPEGVFPTRRAAPGSGPLTPVAPRAIGWNMSRWIAWRRGRCSGRL